MTYTYTMVGEVSDAAPGLSNITLNGAISGFLAFDDAQALGTGSLSNIPVIARIEDSTDATKWEITRGLYTKSGGTKTLTRPSTPRTSSAAGAKVNFANVVNVYVSMDAPGLGPESAARSYALTAGTSTAYTATMKPPIRELIDGMEFRIEWHTACGDNPTLNVDSKGAKNLKFFDGASIFNDALPSGGRDIVQYRAATDDYRIIGRVSNAQWTTYVPTITAASGTITAYTINSARFKRSGIDIEVAVLATITTVGTASGALFITQPAGVLSGTIGKGANLTQAHSAVVTVEATRFVYRKYDGTFGVSNGDQISMTAKYEASS